jgi:hypothetical protein
VEDESQPASRISFVFKDWGLCDEEPSDTASTSPHRPIRTVYFTHCRAYARMDGFRTSYFDGGTLNISRDVCYWILSIHSPPRSDQSYFKTPYCMDMETCYSMRLLHSLETLLGGLLSLLGIVGVVDGSLETTSDVVGVLVALALASRLEVAGVKDLWRSEDTYKGGDNVKHTSRLCCLDSSEVLGSLMLALWPPAT